jgi:HEAT repeat protein
MRIKGKFTLQLAILLLTLGLLSPSAGKLFASEYDPLVAALQRDDWQAYFSTPVQRENLNRSFDTLLDLVWNKGVNWRIRIRGIVLLGETSNPRRAHILIRMFHNPFFNAECPSIKMSLITALSSIEDDPKVVDTLIGAMSDSEIEVREAAIQALGRLESEQAVPFLIGKLNDNSFAIRRSAILSLSRIRDARALPFLRKIAEGDQDLVLRSVAASALTKMQS